MTNVIVIVFACSVLLLTWFAARRVGAESSLGMVLVIAASCLLVMVVQARLFQPSESASYPHSIIARGFGIYMISLSGVFVRLLEKRGRRAFAALLSRIGEELAAEAPMSNSYLKWPVRWFAMCWMVSIVLLMY